MMHVTIPHASTKERFTLSEVNSSAEKTARPTSSPAESTLLTDVMGTVQFMGPVLGLLVYVAAFASENWVLAGSSYQWGLLTKCGPASNSSGASVTCQYMSAGENEGEER